MALRNYSAISPVIPLQSGVDNITTALPVTTTTNFPTAPFLLGLDRGDPAKEEVCLCTAVAAGSFTVVRGYDGTSAKSHDINAPIQHVVSAIDYREANLHVNDASLHVVKVGSGARPATPTEGDIIYVTDLRRHETWDGDAWVVLFTMP